MRFYGLFRENAIIQRGYPVAIRGYSEKTAVCRLQGGDYQEEKTVIPDKNGKFEVCFSPVLDVKSQFVLSLQDGKETISIHLRFGDVLLTMGQSNMAYGVGAMRNRKQILRDAEKADIAVFDIFEAYGQENGEIHRPAKPMDDYERDWKWIDGKDSAIGASSAVGVMTALKLHKKTGVPIGLVNTALGGVSIDTYLPRECADENEIIKKYLISIDKYIPEGGAYNVYGGANYSQLGGIYNEKIAPLSNCKFKAILWYQGENSVSDFGTGQYFAVAMETLVRKYKKMFGEETFFCATNIALDYYNYSHWGYNYINEAIDLGTKKAGATSFPIYDESMQWLVEDGALYYHPIHPVEKHLIASRFAKAIYTANYTDKPWVPPYIGNVTCDGRRLIAEIYPQDVQLAGKKIYGFTVAGEDGKFVIAEAEVVADNKVIVYSPYVKKPKELTYAFAPYNNRCNLKTIEGDAIKQYRTTMDDANVGRYIELNAFSDCSEMFVEERNFGADLGCIGRVRVFESGRITRTNNVKLKICKEKEPCLQVRFQPTNRGYYYFGFSPEINILGYDAGLEKYKYITLVMRANIDDVEFHGALLREEKGRLYRLTGEERIVKLTKEYASYTLNTDMFIDGALSAYPSNKDSLRKANVLEFYFRSQNAGLLEVCSIILHD